MKLNIRTRAKKRLLARGKEPLLQPLGANQTWSMDFMQDSLWNGKKYRLLNIMDDHNRELLSAEADYSLTSAGVIRALEWIKEYRGLPKTIRVDNGPELISKKLAKWCLKNQVELLFIQPGKPTQNAFIERFNGIMRKEVLNAYIFQKTEEVRFTVNKWMIDYDQYRPHQALGNKIPLEYAA